MVYSTELIYKSTLSLFNDAHSYPTSSAINNQPTLGQLPARLMGTFTSIPGNGICHATPNKLLLSPHFPATPPKITWNLKMMLPQRNLLFQGSLSGSMLVFGGVPFSSLLPHDAPPAKISKDVPSSKAIRKSSAFLQMPWTNHSFKLRQK